ncbi:hypothetical protein Ahy_A04g017774 [Arachis hypogaea]|uniref:Pentatricopeptide repeat-containing protein n=1 Tax=Arachis hypogaea TaxID=3818 RepID=A0A445DC03_ARAHY|nr:hypothetical protein Ahy_A04g017774 [Arachis hypogaea]
MSKQQRFLWTAAERKCLYILQRNTTTFSTLLQIHAFILRHSLHHNLNLLAKFITTCSSLAAATASLSRRHAIVHLARRFFDHTPHNRDEFLFNTMISTHFAIRQLVEPFALYRDFARTRGLGFEPGGYTFTAMVKGCTACSAKKEGVQLGCMDLAKDLFEKMGDKNVISWTSMISGYCHNGDVESARLMFDLMPDKNLFTWNAMIGGYCWNKRPHEALRLFHEMQSSAVVEPNEVTLVSIVPAIADLGALDLGGWVHKFAQRRNLDRYANVRTALIDMYAKCGEITKAKLLFMEMPEKETSSWNALINGFAVNGCAKEALEAFAMMMHEGFEPNKITMIGVLSACSHCGLVEDGRKWFKAMEKFGLTPQIEHYGCMVDLLGRAGCLDEAEKLIRTMPYDANEIILSSFLFACGYFNDVTRAERVLQEAVKSGKWCVGDYVMMRNLYATEQRWRDVEDVKQRMKKGGSYKEVACSVIEVDGGFREFIAEDIQLTLVQLWGHMKTEMTY